MCVAFLQVLKSFAKQNSPGVLNPEDISTGTKAEEDSPLSKIPKLMDLSPRMVMKCYMCKWRLRDVSSLNPTTCNACNRENEIWRTARVDLGGRFAVVTGARIKIGFQTALRLLRNGCFVIGTSRYGDDDN